ncbi:uncharacterized protein LOC133173684 [Saccostrea echinata]|uniref:uncharacterized protein LOC133173684 n=1 Tax=Saccostrea echinata TaxID=191078 RepID=UPI002A7EF32D|nr:uncharacterized protein LOC133173684 [Saccostrea echinata]
MEATMKKNSHDARNRQFYSLPKEHTTLEHIGHDQHSKECLIEYIRKNVIGKDKIFSGPFGLRKVTYVDYIASGRALKFIEDYIQNEVLPDYGNTHTTTSLTSLQTTLYRHEARDIIRNSVHASEHDSVIFCGSGTTAAVHKLVHALDLEQAPVVFVGPYEHHSSFLPWININAVIVRIKEDGSGNISISDLESKLQHWKSSGRPMIGCFCAASNITGGLVDVNTITICLHKHGALAFWDYATAAPYVKIDMNPVLTSCEDQPYVYKDAIFMSAHKFIGGVQTPGILVAKKKLFRNKVPSNCGGGSVFYVRRDNYRFLQEPEFREEGGTPAIVESIRAGLVFQLKNAVSTQTIMEKEEMLRSIAVEALKDSENLVLLGSGNKNSLPVFSFLVYNPESGRFLHHNYVASLLNDLFGIQARGGCACAGPYAMDLLGLDEMTSTEIENLLAEDTRLDRTHLRRYREYSHREIIRPGFVRINLPYFMDEETVQFVLEAVRIVAKEGWKLLPQYMFNPETGEWRQKDFQVFKDRKWLDHISYRSGEMSYKVPPHIVKGPLPTDYKDCLEKSKELLRQAMKTKYQLPDHTHMFDDQAKKYRWFLLPSEAADTLSGHTVPNFSSQLPFCPPSLRDKLGLPPFVLEVMKKDGVVYAPATLNQSEMSQHSEFSEKLVQDLEREYSEKVKCDSESTTKPTGCDKDELNLNSEKTQIDNSTEREGEDLNDRNSEINNVCPLICTSRKRDLQDKATDVSSLNGACSDSKQIKHEKTEVTKRSMSDHTSNRQNTKTCVNKAKGSSTKKSPASKWFSPPKTIFTKFLKGVEDYSMLKDGDRVLVCLSGGKDSLSLLHTIRQYQFYCKAKGLTFEFGAVTVDPQTPSYDPSPLKQYLASLNVPYFYESQCIMDQAKSLENCASICSFCSRMKRGRIYACARKNGYNVHALGQHLDDLCESFLMSFFHNGILRTMKAHYDVEEGDLRVIRPFVYVREKDLRLFAEKNKLPVIAENCPACFEAPKERHRTKQLLAAQEILFPNLYNSMMAAMKPIMAINKTGVKVTDFLNPKGDDIDDMDI